MFDRCQLICIFYCAKLFLFQPDAGRQERLDRPLSEFIRSTFGIGGAVDDDDDSTNVQDNEEAETPSGEPNAGGLLHTLFSSMSLGDMISLARGTDRQRVFERSRRAVRDYLRNDNESAATTNSADHLAERFYTELFVEPSSFVDLAHLELRMSDESVDFAASLERLVKHHLRRLLEHMLLQPDASDANSSQQQATTWSEQLIDAFHLLVNHLVALSRACISDADGQLARIVTAQIGQHLVTHQAATQQQQQQQQPSMSLFQGIFDSFVRRQVEQLIQGVRLGRADIEQFIVAKTAAPVAPSTATTNSEVKTEQAVTSSTLTATETEPVATAPSAPPQPQQPLSDDDERYDSVSSTLSGRSSSMDIDRHYREHKMQQINALSASTAAATPTQTPASASATGPATAATTSSASSSEWSGLVPAEWVPIIENDVAAAAAAAAVNGTRTRPAFSDAYTSGMPSKRRKLFAAATSAAAIIGSSSSNGGSKSGDVGQLNRDLFKQVLSRTMDKVELQAQSSLTRSQLIDTKLSDDDELVQQFQAEFDRAIGQRLRSDADYQEIIAARTQPEQPQQQQQHDDVAIDDSEATVAKEKTQVDDESDLVYNTERFKFSRKHFN